MLHISHHERVGPTAVLGLNEIPVDEQDYVQPRELWRRVFDDEERAQWIETATGALEGVPAPLRQAVVEMFSKEIGRASCRERVL